MPAVDLGQRPRIRRDVAWVRIADEVVVVDRNERVHVLAGTAVAMWPLFDGTVTVADLVDDVVAVFGVRRETAAADVGAFVESVLAAGWIETMP